MTKYLPEDPIVQFSFPMNKNSFIKIYFLNLIISPDSSRQFYTMLGYAQFQKRLYFQPKKKIAKSLYLVLKTTFSPLFKLTISNIQI